MPLLVSLILSPLILFLVLSTSPALPSFSVPNTSLNLDPVFWASFLTPSLLFLVPRFSFLWTVGNKATTIIHELGHATSALFLGSAEGIVINSHRKAVATGASGYAITRTRTKRGQRIITFFGYPTPVLLGLWLTLASLHGWTDAVGITLLTSSIILLVLIRNFHGLLIVLLFLASCVGVFFFTPTPVSLALSASFGVVLTVRGVVDIVKVCAAVGKGASSSGGAVRGVKAEGLDDLTVFSHPFTGKAGVGVYIVAWWAWFILAGLLMGLFVF